MLPLAAFEERVDLAVDEIDRIIGVANRKRRDHHRLGVEVERILEVLQRLGARIPGNPDPGLDRDACGVDPVAFVDHHARDLLAAPIIELVPLAGSAGGEDNIGAVAALHRPAHNRALLVLEHFAVAVENGDDRHREPRIGHITTHFAPVRAPRHPPPSDNSQLSFRCHRTS